LKRIRRVNGANGVQLEVILCRNDRLNLLPAALIEEFNLQPKIVKVLSTTMSL
jgi:hypothetical protein